MQIHPSRLAFGLCVLMFGIALLLDQLGIVPAATSLRYWPLGLVVIGLGIVAHAFIPGPPDSPRQHDRHAGGVIVALFVAAVIGGAWSRSHGDRRLTDGRINLVAVLGGDQRIVTSDAFTGGTITAVMGGADVDLRGANIPDGTVAQLDVFAMWGGVKLRVPEGWQVDMQADGLLGGVSDRRSASARAGRASGDGAAVPAGASASAPDLATSRPTLTVHGTALMGGVELRN